MIIAIVQAIGFFNSFNNPIVYAFMNENFKKSCVSTLSRCLRKRTQQRGVVEGPNLSVQFIKPLNRQAFLETGKCDILMHQPVGTGPSLSSNRDLLGLHWGEDVDCPL